MQRAAILGAALALAAIAPPARACDLCSIYASFEARELRLGWYGSLFEQFTDFGTLQDDGTEVANEADQSLDSSFTQFVFGYQFNPSVGVQVNAPYIDRRFRRPEEGVMATGSETGLGDLAVVAHWRPVQRYGGESIFVWSLLGGVKLPTGDSDRLREELAEHHDEGEEEGEHHGEGLPAGAAKHEGHDHGPASAVHGHDLALGSGSTDAVVGSSALFSRKRFFASVTMQYALRRRGDFDYRYANDLTWNLSPGYFVWLTHGRSLSVGLNLSGEKKGEDDLEGEPLDDTAIDTVYGGISATYADRGRLYAELAVDLPIEQDNSGLQILPDSRLRAGLTVRF
jgi:hypothetical protein